MKLYLAGASSLDCNEYVFEKGYDKLYSFENDKSNIEKWNSKRKDLSKQRLFIDSGAFSAWTKGKNINVDEYINYINQRSDYICLYGQIDSIPGDRVHGATHEQVIESAQKTWKNYLYMRTKMKNPDGLLYTFHIGEPLSFLENAMEWKDEGGNHIPYIALGGMVGKTKEIRKQFLDSCFEVIGKSSNPNVKVHAFGMTDFELLEQYPITSADSTSWIMTGATGSIMTKFGTVVVSENQKNDPNYYEHLPQHLLNDLYSEISKYGFTLEELKTDNNARIKMNANFMVEKANSISYKPLPKKRKLF